MSVKANLVEAERTILRGTNFFKVPTKEEITEKLVIPPLYWLLASLCVAAVVVVICWR